MIESDRIRRLNVSRHFFVSSFLFIYYITRAIVEKSDKKKKASSGRTVKLFLVTISFFLFFGLIGSARIRRLNISRHLFIFSSLSLLFIYYTTRAIVEKSDKKQTTT